MPNTELKFQQILKLVFFGHLPFHLILDLYVFIMIFFVNYPTKPLHINLGCLYQMEAPFGASVFPSGILSWLLFLLGIFVVFIVHIFLLSSTLYIGNKICAFLCCAVSKKKLKTE